MECNDEDVVVLLDGDDWLYDNKVFNILDKAYSDDDVWVTWGSMFRTGDSKLLKGKPISKDLPFREQGGLAHLRTLKSFVFKKIPDRYLRSPTTGKYFNVCTDKALMYAAIELAGVEHCRVIKETLYAYNTDSRGNIFRTHSHAYRKAVRGEVKKFTPLKQIVRE